MRWIILFMKKRGASDSARVLKKLAKHVFKLVGLMETIWPPSVDGTRDRKNLVHYCVKYFRDMGGWSTKEDLPSYPKKIRKNAVNAASFYPSYFRALSFFSTQHENGFIDTEVQMEIIESDIKTYLSANMDEAVWKSLKSKNQKRLVRCLRSWLDRRISHSQWRSEFRPEVLETIIKDRTFSKLDDPSIDLILDYLEECKVQLEINCYRPLKYATPKGVKLFSLVNIPSVQQSYVPVPKLQLHTMWSTLDLGTKLKSPCLEQAQILSTSMLTSRSSTSRDLAFVN